MASISTLEQKTAHESDLHSHRPCSKLAVNSLMDNVLLEEPVLERDFLTKKAGCLGFERLAASVPSMKTTFDMVGRSPGSSCTHNSPTFIHLKNSLVLQVSLSDASMRSNALFSLHNFHACKPIDTDTLHRLACKIIF